MFLNSVFLVPLGQKFEPKKLKKKEEREYHILSIVRGNQLLHSMCLVVIWILGAISWIVDVRTDTLFTLSSAKYK